MKASDINLQIVNTDYSPEDREFLVKILGSSYKVHIYLLNNKKRYYYKVVMYNLSGSIVRRKHCRDWSFIRKEILIQAIQQVPSMSEYVASTMKIAKHEFL